MPNFFNHKNNIFHATKIALSPWDETAINGVLLGGLFGYLFESIADFSIMNPGRLVIDILRPVPIDVQANVRALRDGKKIKLYEAVLQKGDEVFARATLTCIRKADTPIVRSPNATVPFYPLVLDEQNTPAKPIFNIDPAINLRVAVSSKNNPGNGAVWLNFHYDLFEGQPITPFIHACMIGDMGHGVSGALAVEEWIFINIDINILFIRMPQTPWLLVDAHMESAGAGSSVAHCLFSDEKGLYARGMQTIYIERQS